MDKVIVTSQEVSGVPDVLEGGGVLPAPLPPPIAWWVRVLLAVVLVPLLPLACLAAMVARVLTRGATARVREAWQGLFLSILTASGLLASAALVVLIFQPSHRVGLPAPRTGLRSLDRRTEFPSNPSQKELSPPDLAGLVDGMVFVVSPGSPGSSWQRGLRSSGYGAGVLVAAEPGGYLIATARHVVDGEGWKSVPAAARPVAVWTKGEEVAGGDVVARHKELDLALLWVKRGGSGPSFRQAIRKVEEVVVGEPVFAFGHPQGLMFSFSSGLVSGKRPGGQIQISAPTSPGSSGGPLYDSRARLVGVVSSKVDKSREPNAENLNFAVPVGDLLNPDPWVWTPQGDRGVLEFLRGAAQVPPPRSGADADVPRATGR